MERLKNYKILIFILILFSLSYQVYSYDDYNNLTVFYLTLDNSEQVSTTRYDDLKSNYDWGLRNSDIDIYDGRIGQARRLNSTKSLIEVRTGSNYNLIDQDYTHSVSFNYNVTNTQSHLFSFGSFSSKTKGERAYCRHYTPTFSNSIVYSNNITLNEWHTVTCKRQGDNLSIYVDGKYQNSNIQSLLSVSILYSTSIGVGNYGGGVFVDGKIGYFDDSWFIDKAISEEDINYLSCNTANGTYEYCTDSMQYPYNFVSIYNHQNNITYNSFGDALDFEIYSPQNTGTLSCDIYLDNEINSSFTKTGIINTYNYTVNNLYNGDYELYINCTDGYWNKTSEIIYFEIDRTCTYDCSNWSICDISRTKSCNQATNTNACGISYSGDFSEFGYPICCYETWQPQYDICLYNNTQLKYYTEQYSCNTTYYLPIDNGTYTACDYCQPDLNLIENVCLWNGTTYNTDIYYEDDNYYSCCVITNLTSDCLLDNTAPYNEINNTLCVDKIEQFDLEIDENVFMTPFMKDNVYATIWLNNTDDIFYCQSYVKTLDKFGIKDKRVIQINPIFEEKTESLISLNSNTYEDREFFITNNGQATVYYTKENIIFDGRPYLFGVECVSNSTGEKLISEKVAYIEYTILNSPTTRFFWAVDNSWQILFTIIFAFMLVLILAFAVYQIKWSGG